MLLFRKAMALRLKDEASNLNLFCGKEVYCHGFYLCGLGRGRIVLGKLWQSLVCRKRSKGLSNKVPQCLHCLFFKDPSLFSFISFSAGSSSDSLWLSERCVGYSVAFSFSPFPFSFIQVQYKYAVVQVYTKPRFIRDNTTDILCKIYKN
ncbi:hypothetical protein NQ315_000346 [Exocentrus adspersus]|uniref:Uncharacterized protein n=1 Tax=Exocentrus adspersus TaxID=1586481 RepID=A0AAV8VRV5_9CUCU|nr:hypothetical protein NQ315_000346 [Exocentrus adspersus]